MKPISSQRTQTGFTLIEAAIILGIMGLVGAAIWAAANVVRAREPVHDMAHLTTEIAGNVRSVYTGFPNAVPPGRDDVAAQIAGSLYPLSVINRDKTDTINSWGGNIRIRFATAPVNGFAVEYSLPASLSATQKREACTGMVTRLPGTATNYAGAFADTLPNPAPPLDPAQGGRPHFVFINNGAWVNVTGKTPTTLFGADGAGACNGFAYYYRL